MSDPVKSEVMSTSLYRAAGKATVGYFRRRIIGCITEGYAYGDYAYHHRPAWGPLVRVEARRHTKG